MDEFKAEAEAFDQRINVRTEHGFIPDLRRLEANEYFYKSFWRHPHYADLYVGSMCRSYIEFIDEYVGNKARILDLGCGAGYFGLELARNGHEVVGMDISESNIQEAIQTLKENTYLDGFGSLEYHVGSYHDLTKFDKFDVILSSGFMHHIPNISEVVDFIHDGLKEEGLVIWHEPQHKKWTMNDAAVTLIVRLLLAKTDNWHDEKLKNVESSEQLMDLTKMIHEEYRLERDVDEVGGQSPNDLSCDGEEILNTVSNKFEVLLTKPSFSFIYRVLGGLRGNDQNKLNEMASLLALIDETYVKNGIIDANYFYGVARKK